MSFNNDEFFYLQSIFDNIGATISNDKEYILDKLENIQSLEDHLNRNKLIIEDYQKELINTMTKINKYLKNSNKNIFYNQIQQYIKQNRINLQQKQEQYFYSNIKIISQLSNISPITQIKEIDISENQSNDQLKNKYQQEIDIERFFKSTDIHGMGEFLDQRLSLNETNEPSDSQKEEYKIFVEYFKGSQSVSKSFIDLPIDSKIKELKKIKYELRIGECGQYQMELNAESNVGYSPEDIERLKGESYLNQRKQKEAIKQFFQCIHQNPEQFEVNVNLGYCFLSLNKYQEAISFYYSAIVNIKNYSKKAIVQNNVGLVFQKWGDINTAILNYKNSINYDSNPNVLNAIGVAQQKQGNIESAIEFYEKTIKIGPNIYQGQLNLGKIQKKLKLYENSNKNLLIANEIKPNIKDIQKMIAQNHLYQMNYKDSSNCFLKAIKEDPKNALLQNDQGESLFRDGKVDDAVFQFQKALKINPCLLESNMNMGQIHQIQGNIQDSLRHYVECQKYYPNHPEASFNLGVLYLYLGASFESITNCFSTSGYQDEMMNANIYKRTVLIANVYYGTVLIEHQKQKEGIKMLNKTLEQDSNLSVSNLQLGKAYLNQCNQAKAIFHFMKIININEDNYTNENQNEQFPLHCKVLKYKFNFKNVSNQIRICITQINQDQPQLAKKIKEKYQKEFGMF